jgi:hypothetical protein
MWSWFNCYLSGRHEYGMWCEPGNIFLRCVHCGRRSSGWAMNNAAPPPAPAKRGRATKITGQPAAAAMTTSAAPPASAARVIPFNRAAAS